MPDRVLTEDEFRNLHRGRQIAEAASGASRGDPKAYTVISREEVAELVEETRVRMSLPLDSPAFLRSLAELTELLPEDQARALDALNNLLGIRE